MFRSLGNLMLGAKMSALTQAPLHLALGAIVTKTLVGPGALSLHAKAAAVPAPSAFGGVAPALLGGGFLLKRQLRQHH